MSREAIIERTIHAYLQEIGYDSFVPAEKVAAMAQRIDKALPVSPTKVAAK